VCSFLEKKTTVDLFTQFLRPHNSKQAKLNRGFGANFEIMQEGSVKPPAPFCYETKETDGQILVCNIEGNFSTVIHAQIVRFFLRLLPDISIQGIGQLDFKNFTLVNHEIRSCVGYFWI
jgi:hypothetical protein